MFFFYNHLYHPSIFRNLFLKSDINDNLRGISCLTDTCPAPRFPDRYIPGPISPLTTHTPSIIPEKLDGRAQPVIE